MSAGLVTLHLAPGQQLKDLIQAVRMLTGERHVRTVSGRAGVLVEADVALQYLSTRLAFSRLSVVGLVELQPEPEPEPGESGVAEDVAQAAPAKPVKSAKRAPAKKKIEEV